MWILSLLLFSSSSLQPRGLSLSQIQTFIPKKWRQSVEQLENLSNFKINDEPIIQSLFTSLKDFSRQGQLLEAFKTFSLIHSNANKPAFYELIAQSFSSLLLTCTSFKSLTQGKNLHAQIICLGLEQEPILVPKLVSFYSAFDFLIDAQFIMERSITLQPLPWNVLISSYVRNGFCVEALTAYKQMVKKGIKPDSFTYPSVLKACGEELNLAFGRQVHRSIDASGLDWNLFVQNALISMYGRCGETEVARKLFEQMPERDAVSWNSMVSTYASKGMWSEAFEVFDNMRAENIELNIIIWNTIAGGCIRIANYRGALELLSQMMSSGIHLDPVAVIIGLGACAHIGIARLGKEIHGLAIRNYYHKFDNVNNALITMYSRSKDLKHAYVIFQLIEYKSVVTWNSIISGYASWDLSEETSFLFREMLIWGVEPNYVTIASILPLCARVANLQHGREFHCYITRRKSFKDYLLLWNALVDMYARSGKISMAKKLFYSLSNKDKVTYTSLIAGYGTQGEGKIAIKLYEEMIKLRIKPDHVTMTAVLSACSHSGLVVEGQMFFERMQSVYGISPRLEHFSCMVDLFGRAGFLKKAQEVIARTPYQPTSAMWATLVGACQVHGNIEIGEWAAEKLLEMRPENSGYYVLIANMYAAAGCWSKLAKVRTFMRDLGVRKDPGCALVDTGAGFSPFLVGDTSNTQSHAAYPLLATLTEQMKDVYVAYENFDFGDEIF